MDRAEGVETAGILTCRPRAGPKRPGRVTEDLLSRALLTTQRAVVLTAAELELARQKFGPLYATRLPLFVLDHDQRRGFVVWDASWIGGVPRLRRDGTEWQVESVMNWIT